MTARDDLQASWRRLWQRLGADDNGKTTFDDLVARYGEPHRAYHTLEHVAACLKIFDEGRHLAEHPDEVEFAIWLHDAIYDPRATDNEVRSAALADDMLQRTGCGQGSRRRVHDLIMATCHRAQPMTLDEQLLADVDLSILGETTDVFDAYRRAIRREYNWVSDEDYRAGRGALLRGFLERDRIYATTFYRMRFEVAAHANLTRELAALDAKTPT